MCHGKLVKGKPHFLCFIQNLSKIFYTREVIPDYPKDACRIKATFNISKVVGFMHIILGK